MLCQRYVTSSRAREKAGRFSCSASRARDYALVPRELLIDRGRTVAFSRAIANNIRDIVFISVRISCDGLVESLVFGFASLMIIIGQK